MSEVDQIVPALESLPEPDVEGDEVPDVGDDGELDEEADALLKELEESQMEVQRMLAEQRQQASELGGMKDSLAEELHQLQDEAWKLQVFAELETLKRQLAAINNLDADLDAMETKLEESDGVTENFDKELTAARAGTEDLLARLGLSPPARRGPGAAVVAAESASPAADGGGTDDDKDVDALQDELDAELATMYKQLQAIKAESKLVAARKAQLELELMTLMKEGADDLNMQMEDMGLEEGEEGDAKADEGEGAAEVLAAVEALEA